RIAQPATAPSHRALRRPCPLGRRGAGRSARGRGRSRPRPWLPRAPAGTPPRAPLIGGATRLAFVADRVVELVSRDPQVDPRVDVLQLRRYAILLDDDHVGRRG